MKKGLVIFLNGTSSSGKTTIAKALQDKLEEPYMYVSVDDFFHMYPEKYLNPTNQDEAIILSHLIPTVVSGLHKCVASLAQSGNNVLVDHVLQENGWLKECVENWKDLDVLFVGVRCPLRIAEQREKERGDRNIGTAQYQFESVHSHGLYDLEVDTSVLDVNECVTRIMALINNTPKKLAFQELSIRFMLAESPLP
ncbi:MAG: chloramphenicol phosphotransferase [Chloroflexi bacterium HGW-Chloroflexi-2]|jgi:chloramphenicol 3-O phosphotransferase|nr:MAG: chloramphenicol phosphotransferase [Chloroflexi bacterium HGW-Chloroflexi-2]